MSINSGNMKDREDRAGPTPYGPHRDQKVDEAAGGADSSPLDSVSSEERPQVARDRNEKNLEQPTFDQPKP